MTKQLRSGEMTPQTRSGEMTPQTRFFVTGAAHGIGAATARLLVARGHRVTLCDVDGEAAATLAAQLGASAHAVAFDVRDTAAWEGALDQAWAHWGGIDVLVNNAGLIHSGLVREQSIEQIEHMMQVNFLGLVKGVRAALPRLIAQGHGHVIDVGSLAGFTPLKGQAVYAATKHAVRAFHHGCALEWADSPISWTLVCPGAVDTGMLRQQVNQDSNALAFSTAALEPEAVAAAILRAAQTRPHELLLPAAQGFALRLLGALPAVVRALTRHSERQGLRNLAKRRSESRP